MPASTMAAPAAVRKVKPSRFLNTNTLTGEHHQRRGERDQRRDRDLDVAHGVSRQD